MDVDRQILLDTLKVLRCFDKMYPALNKIPCGGKNGHWKDSEYMRRLRVKLVMLVGRIKDLLEKG